MLPRLKEIINDSPAREQVLGKVFAFVSSALAVYLIASLWWPLTVSEFRSLAAIELTVQPGWQAEAITPLVAQCIKAEAEPPSIEALIDLTQQRVPLRSPAIEYRDHQAIAASLQVGTQPHANAETYRFILSYDGSGLPDEQVFLELLAQRVAYRCQQITQQQDASGNLIAMPSSESTLEKVTRALWIANQIDADLTELAASRAGGASGQFQFASTGRRTEDEDELRRSLKSIDTSTLRQLLQDVQATIQSPPTEGAKASVSSTVETKAIGATPGRLGWLVVLMSASLFGATVAFYYQPLSQRGFASVQSIADGLKLPVVGTIRSSANTTQAEEREKQHWANRVADASVLVVLAALVVIGGFLVIDSAIREAFFENPFDGVARMIRVFVGY